MGVAKNGVMDRMEGEVKGLTRCSDSRAKPGHCARDTSLHVALILDKKNIHIYPVWCPLAVFTAVPCLIFPTRCAHLGYQFLVSIEALYNKNSVCTTRQVHAILGPGNNG